ncbi:MAG: hypothetical protein HY318_20925 [Armatimonadetes bacterium]|nr:hypothetical protein [Armatimonadota bacterium]
MSVRLLNPTVRRGRGIFRSSMLALMLLAFQLRTALASYEYRYVEAENYSATEGSGLREEGFTSWMRHPSHGKVMVTFGNAFLEYDLKDLGEGTYHVFVRGLAWASGADVDILWDGKKVGRASYQAPGTALKWSREVGVVQGPGDHKLRIANEPKNIQAPYLDVLLLTTQEGYQPSDSDQDFESYITPLPLLRLKTPKGEETVSPEPEAKVAEGASLDLLTVQAGPLTVGNDSLLLSLRNLKMADRRIELSARLGETYGSEKTVDLPPGAIRQIELPCEAASPGRQSLKLRLAEGGRSLLEGSYPVSIPNPVSVSLDEYAYPVGTKEARWKAAFFCSPEVPKETSVSITLARSERATPLDQKKLAGALPANETRLQIGNLPVGRYSVNARIFRRGKLMVEDTRDLLLFRPSPLDTWEPVKRTEARGDTLFMNGKPFLGRELFHAPPDEKTRNQGFNLVQCAGSDPDPRDSIQEHLDSCAKVGLWGTVALFNNRYFLAGDHFDLDHLREAIQRFKDHPAVFAWDLIDEPDGADISPERVAEAARLIRELDPNHLVWVNLCRPDRAMDYLESQDLWSFDFYPLPSLGPFAYMQWLKISDEKLRGKRPIGSCLQTYAYEGSRMPMPDELRNSCYLHMIHGYKWLGFYSYFDPEPSGCLSRDPVLWSFTKALNSELRELASVILDPSPFAAVEASAGADVFQAAVKQGKGGRCLIAINGSAKPLRVKMTVPGTNAKVLFEEDRTVKIKDGTLVDDFEPLAVHVYSLR